MVTRTTYILPVFFCICLFLFVIVCLCLSLLAFSRGDPGQAGHQVMPHKMTRTTLWASYQSPSPSSLPSLSSPPWRGSTPSQRIPPRMTRTTQPSIQLREFLSTSFMNPEKTRRPHWPISTRWCKLDHQKQSLEPWRHDTR